MIRMNFAEEMGGGNTSFSLDEESSKRGSKKALVWILATFVLIAGGVFYYFQSSQGSDLVTVDSSQPKKPGMQSPHPSAQSPSKTGELASGANVDAQSLPNKPKAEPQAPVFEVPVHIVSSNESVQRFLSGLLKDTPLQVGFNEISILAPKYYYMKGLAADKVMLKGLENGVKKWTGKMEKPVLKARGAAGVAQEFTIYGELLQRQQKNSSALTAAQRSKAVQDVETYLSKFLSSGTQLKSKGVSQLPKSKKEVFSVTAGVPFNKLSQFVSAIADKKVPVHIEQIELRVNAQEEMDVELLLAVYSKL